MILAQGREQAGRWGGRLGTVGFDAGGLWVDGRRVQLVSGAIHYWRIPRAEWEERLRASHDGGLNTVETVVPWNIHEYRPGEYRFDDNRDLDAFLTLCGRLGLYAFVRPSPYICAELDAGGLPLWLPLEPGVAFRRANPVYLAHVDRWYDRLIPLLAAQQWTRGGPVVLVQVENEYGYFGDAQEPAYLEFLRAALVSRGIEVPLSTCDWPGTGMRLAGAIHGGNCGSDFRAAVETLRQAQPEAFPFVSELWLAWFDAWHGQHHTRPARQVATALREVLAAGGHYNFYMWAGGTNTGYWAGRTTGGDHGAFITTSYDYDAPLGETGNLTEKFYECRLVNWLAQSLQELFAGSAPVPSPFSPSDPACVVSARRTPAGGMLALRNPTAEGRRLHLRAAAGGRFPGACAIPVAAGETVLLPWEYKLTEDATLVATSAEVLALVRGRRLALLVYGEAQAPYELRLRATGRDLEISGCFPAPGAVEVRPVGDLDVVVLERATARVTWIDGPAGRQSWTVDPARGRRTAQVQLPALRWERADPVALATRRRGEIIHTPVPLEALGIPQGYAWYRTTFTHPGGTTDLVLTGVRDRATVLVNGEAQGVIGAFAAFARLPIRTRPGPNTLLLLLEALGHYTFTARLGETKGLLGAAYIGGRPVAIDSWRPAQTPTASWYLDLPWRPGEGLLLRLTGMGGVPLTIGVDGEPLHRHRSVNDDDTFVELDLTPHLRPGGRTLWLRPERPLQPDALPRHQAVAFDLLGRLPGPWAVLGGVVGEPSTVAAGQHAFSRLQWEPLDTAPATAGPTLYRTRFTLRLPPDAIPLQLRTRGLDKGVAWLNGHHLGRYWAVGPQRALVIPREWLAPTNRLVIFDETGSRPEGVGLIQHEGFFASEA